MFLVCLIRSRMNLVHFLPWWFTMVSSTPPPLFVSFPTTKPVNPLPCPPATYLAASFFWFVVYNLRHFPSFFFRSPTYPKRPGGPVEFVFIQDSRLQLQYVGQHHFGPLGFATCGGWISHPSCFRDDQNLHLHRQRPQLGHRPWGTYFWHHKVGHRLCNSKFGGYKGLPKGRYKVCITY